MSSQHSSSYRFPIHAIHIANMYFLESKSREHFDLILTCQYCVATNQMRNKTALKKANSISRETTLRSFSVTKNSGYPIVSVA